MQYAPLMQILFTAQFSHSFGIIKNSGAVVARERKEPFNRSPTLYIVNTNNFDYLPAVLCANLSFDARELHLDS